MSLYRTSEKIAKGIVILAVLITVLGISYIASAKVRACGVDEPEVYDWSELVAKAATDCRNARYTPDPAYLASLLMIEKDAGIPPKYRGMTLAAACHESGFNPAPRRGDGGKAVGMFQMWPLWETSDGIDRENEHQSAMAWTERIVDAIGRAKAIGCKRPVEAAWSWVARGPRGYKCSTTGHARVLRRWHRSLKRLN